MPRLRKALKRTDFAVPYAEVTHGITAGHGRHGMGVHRATIAFAPLERTFHLIFERGKHTVWPIVKTLGVNDQNSLLKNRLTPDWRGGACSGALPQSKLVVTAETAYEKIPSLGSRSR